MKRQFGTDINMIKYEVCVEVAKLAFAGELETRRDEIPYTIILAPSLLKAAMPILIRKNVKSAAAVPRLAHTMLLPT